MRQLRKVYLTVDLEEWYHLDYLKDFDLKGSRVEVIPRIFDFLDMLDRYGVKATFFVVAEIAEKNADILREIVERGHVIGSHGLDHELLSLKSNDTFREEIRKSKEILERVAGCSVEGYRASCFSMDRDKLDLAAAAGFRFDSSKIRFKQHPLYRDLDLTGFEPVDDLVYSRGWFAEYEIPTLEIGKYSLPISGGGYVRLFPFWLLRLLIRAYEKRHSSFLLYLHPFELTDVKLPLPKALGAATKFRALVGRKRNLKKIEKLIVLFQKQGARFETMSGR